MSYCIDDEMTYWGGLQTLKKGYERNISMYNCCGRSPQLFEVNRQMCDIVLLAKENIRLCKENKERSRRLDEAFKKKFGILKENDMEKNKMTKAEAFEWLKCKKIDSYGCLEEVQEKLFSLGITWVNGDTTVANHGIYLFIGEDGVLTHGGCDEIFWKRHCYEEVKAEDILSLEIEEECNYSQFETMTNEPCDEIKAVQELLRNSKHLKDRTLIITKDNACVL